MAMTSNEATGTRAPHDTTYRSSDHDHHASTDGQDDQADEHADAHTIPSPRQSATAQPSQRPGQRSTSHHRGEAANHAPATLTAGPDGTLWVTVNGADIQQLADKISAVCDVLTQTGHRSPG